MFLDQKKIKACLKINRNISLPFFVVFQKNMIPFIKKPT